VKKGIRQQKGKPKANYATMMKPWALAWGAFTLSLAGSAEALVVDFGFVTALGMTRIKLTLLKRKRF